MDVLLILVIVVFSNWRSEAFGIENSRFSRTKRDKDANTEQAFLEQFGYLRSFEGERGTAVHSADRNVNALRNFQRMTGLKVTGRLDAATRAKMLAPRCGVPDVTPAARGRRVDPSNFRANNFYAPGYAWKKKTITWRISAFSDRTSRKSRDRISYSNQRRAISEAFDLWSRVSALSFREVAGSHGSSDIDIKFSNYAHGDGNPFDGPGRVLAHAFYPNNGAMHFDDSEEWTLGTPRGSNLKIIAAHEIGHALGLGHSNVDGALMSPYYQGYQSFSGLPHDDIVGIQSMYGPPSSGGMPPRRPTTTNRPSWTQRPPISGATCNTKYDAVMQAHDTRVYIFRGDMVWRTSTAGVEYGFPKNIQHVFRGAPNNINAAVYSWRTRYTYIFKGNTIWTFYGFQSVKKEEVNARGFPKKIDAAVMGRDGLIYLFSRSFFFRVDERYMLSTSYTANWIGNTFRGVPNSIEAAVRLNDGCYYFFKGDKYRKYDERYGQVMREYPKYSAPAWMGLKCSSAIIPK